MVTLNFCFDNGAYFTYFLYNLQFIIKLFQPDSWISTQILSLLLSLLLKPTLHVPLQTTYICAKSSSSCLNNPPH